MFRFSHIHIYYSQLYMYNCDIVKKLSLSYMYQVEIVKDAQTDNNNNNVLKRRPNIKIAVIQNSDFFFWVKHIILLCYGWPRYTDTHYVVYVLFVYVRT